VGVNRHFQASRASQPIGCLLAVMSYGRLSSQFVSCSAHVKYLISVWPIKTIVSLLISTTSADVLAVFCYSWMQTEPWTRTTPWTSWERTTAETLRRRLLALSETAINTHFMCLSALFTVQQRAHLINNDSVVIVSINVALGPQLVVCRLIFQ